MATVITVAADGSLTEVISNPTDDILAVTNSSGSAIAANKAVNVYNNAGTLTMRLADSGATNDFQVIGFTTASVASAATGTVRRSGSLAGFTSLTPGTVYFSDPAAPGGIVTTITATSATKIQEVGIATDAVTLDIGIKTKIKRA